MDLIEQAIFTSAETDRSAGYQVVAASPGVSSADLRELAVWGPSHDALLDPTANAVSVNFHPLPSGAYCVSRTTPAGSEYSGRRGPRVYTQCLVVPPEVLRRFANNPFSLMRAALANGSLQLHDEVPKQLEPLRLTGRAKAVDTALLGRLARSLGPEWIASMTQIALAAPALAVVGGPPADHVICGLINCLPPRCRTDFPFSTGLRFSSRREFRIVAFSDDRAEQRRAQRLYNLTVLHLGESPPSESEPIDSWPRFIHRVLKTNRLSFLNSRLSDQQLDVGAEDLHLLGLELLEELDAPALGSPALGAQAWSAKRSPRSPLGSPTASDGETSFDSSAETSQADPAGQEADAEPVESVQPGAVAERNDPEVFASTETRSDFSRPHEAHRRFEKNDSAETVRCKVKPPSKSLEATCPAVLEKLELLDDLVYDAISGKAETLPRLETLWPELCEELDAELLAESREQYLRYALSLWEESTNPNVSAAEQAVHALDVLCLLFNED